MSNVVNYIKESYNELLHNVTWPTVSELLSHARIVLVSTVVLALLILGMDLFFNVLILDGFLYDLGTQSN